MFPLKPKFQVSDIVTESITLVAILVLVVLVWRLCRVYGSQRWWLVLRAGTAIYAVSVGLDLLDEIFTLPKIVPHGIEKPALGAGAVLIAIASASLMRRLTRASRVDDLTGLKNRRYFVEALFREAARAGDEGGVFSLLFLDIKNLRLGGPGMTQLLQADVLHHVTAALVEQTRSQDVVARWSGSTFAVLVQGSGEAALALSQRILESISRIEVREADVTASIGIASYPSDGTGIDQLLSAATERVVRRPG